MSGTYRLKVFTGRDRVLAAEMMFADGHSLLVDYHEFPLMMVSGIEVEFVPPPEEETV